MSVKSEAKAARKAARIEAAKAAGTYGRKPMFGWRGRRLPVVPEVPETALPAGYVEDLQPVDTLPIPAELPAEFHEPLDARKYYAEDVVLTLPEDSEIIKRNRPFVEKAQSAAEARQQAKAERITEAKDLHDSGFDVASIADHMGLAESTIRTYLKA